MIVTSLIGPAYAFVKSCKITIQYATLIISYYFRCVDVHTYEINGIKSLVAKTIKKFYFMLDVWTALNKCSRGKQGSHGLQTLSPVLPHGSLL